MPKHTVSILVAGLLSGASHLPTQSTTLKTQLTDGKRLVCTLTAQPDGGGR